MKIAVIGYSGSGKSTLACTLGEHYSLPVLHLDAVQFLPGWKVRDAEEKQRIVQEFMDGNAGWVIDGTYPRLLYERRMEEADQIVLMLFTPLSCLRRVTKRYIRHRGQCRPDIAEGCEEKLDGEFILWVLWKGRGKRQRERFAGIRKRYPDKCVVLKTQRQIDGFLSKIRKERRQMPPRQANS